MENKEKKWKIELLLSNGITKTVFLKDSEVKTTIEVARKYFQHKNVNAFSGFIAENENAQAFVKLGEILYYEISPVKENKKSI